MDGLADMILGLFRKREGVVVDVKEGMGTRRP